MDQDCRLVEQGRIHLTCNKSFPDERIKGKHVPVQIRGYSVRSVKDVGRPDSLMGILGGCLGLEDPWFGWKIIRAKGLFNVCPRG